MDKFIVRKRPSEVYETSDAEQQPRNVSGTSQDAEQQSKGASQTSVSSVPSCSSKNTKVRLYNEDYLTMGFTWCGDEECPTPECVICGEKLSNASMVPNKLLRHISTKHRHLQGKSVEYFKEILRQKTLQSSLFTKKFKTSDKAQEASYLVAEIIAKNTLPHVVAEKAIIPACCAIVKTMFGPEYECDVKKIPLADNTVGRRIQDMSENIEHFVKTRVGETNLMFTIQLDESTDVTGLAQLVAFIRFIDEGKIVEQYLCCKELPLTTKGIDIFEVVNGYMEKMNLSWKNCVGICTDGAPSMTGSIKGFITLAKQRNENLIITHCFLHREALVAKTIGNDFRSVLDKTIEMINYIKRRPLKSRLLSQICDELGTQHCNLLLHTEVRWLSRGRILSRVYELRDPMLQLFEQENKTEFVYVLKDKLWNTKLAFLSDLFEILNKTNASLQGKGANLLTATDKIATLRDKVDVWLRKTKESNFEMFPLTSKCELRNKIQPLIHDHLLQLRERLDGYFPTLDINQYDWIRNPFALSSTCDLQLVEEEELTDLKNNRTLKLRYQEADLCNFWISIHQDYPHLSRRALVVLLQFSTTYSCESAFSTMTNIKTVKRESLRKLDEEMRVNLSSIRPNIRQICNARQAQVSH